MADIELLRQFAAKISKAGAAISPIPSAPWIDVIENQLGFPLPRLYRTFVKSYEFAPFTVVGVNFYGNTGDPKECDDISSRIFRDRGLAEALVPLKMVHFAAPDYGSDCESYDPLCINMFQPGATDGPIVRIDHEQVLCNCRVIIMQELFPSFKSLVQAAINA